MVSIERTLSAQQARKEQLLGYQAAARSTGCPWRGSKRGWLLPECSGPSSRSSWRRRDRSVASIEDERPAANRGTEPSLSTASRGGRPEWTTGYRRWTRSRCWCPRTLGSSRAIESCRSRRAATEAEDRSIGCWAFREISFLLFS